jgi:hypothetical protein
MVVPTDGPIHRDCWDDWFSSLYCTIMSSISWKCKSTFLMFSHLFLNRSGDLSFVLCYLYCNKREYSILFCYLQTWDSNLHACWCLLIVCTVVLRLLPVLSLTAFWVLIDFCHKVALSYSIDNGACSSRAIASASVLCICLWYRQSQAK